MLRYGLMQVAGASVALSQTLDPYWFCHTFPPFRLPVFLMGCCAAHERLAWKDEAKPRFWSAGRSDQMLESS